MDKQQNHRVVTSRNVEQWWSGHTKEKIILKLD